MNAQGKDWETLQYARTRSGHSLRDMLSAIGGKRIALGRGGDGYHQLMVCKPEIDGLGKKAELVERLGLTPAAVFARKIGLRGQDGFISFIGAGHTSARLMTHPRNGLTWFYLSQEDIAAFRARFVTTSMLAEERGEPWQTIVNGLRKSRIRPFAPEGVEFGAIYMRSEVAQIFRK